jgi:hypothetical protein
MPAAAALPEAEYSTGNPMRLPRVILLESLKKLEEVTVSL